jgi:hypothetical protein
MGFSFQATVTYVAEGDEYVHWILTCKSMVGIHGDSPPEWVSMVIAHRKITSVRTTAGPSPPRIASAKGDTLHSFVGPKM